MAKASLHDVECAHETDDAILVIVDGDRVWVPKSQVHEDSEVWKRGDEGTLVVTEWFADKRGWELD